jgi:hypothetical protein
MGYPRWRHRTCIEARRVNYQVKNLSFSELTDLPVLPLRGGAGGAPGEAEWESGGMGEWVNAALALPTPLPCFSCVGL